MQYQTREVKVELGVVQITTSDERWYQLGEKFVPSVTWITGHYPKGIEFMKWLASKGWDEAEAIKNAGGNRGGKVHLACENLLKGEEVKMDDKYPNREGEPEEFSVKEWECVMSFVAWFEGVKDKIEILGVEKTVYSEKFNYAGTLDIAFRYIATDEKCILDLKTSASIWPAHELQLSALGEASEFDNPKLAILQLGYGKNKKGFKFTEIENKFDLFLAAKKIWANECAGQAPSQREYPLSLKIMEIEGKGKEKKLVPVKTKKAWEK